MNILTLEGVGVSYDGCPALEHIDLAIPEKQITAVTGPSGCGKSTLLKCMNGMITSERGAALQGKISLSGEDIAGMDPQELRRRVGLVFQTPAPFPMSIYQNMTYAPKYYGVKGGERLRKIVQEKLELAGLYEEVKGDLKKNALKLSGGQKQRLCIARALTVEPEVLLLDEPCSALDVKSTAVIEELLMKLKERYTIVIVTHNLAQARRISDRTAFLYEGRLVEYGDTEKLFSDPEKEETRSFLMGNFG